MVPATTLPVIYSVVGRARVVAGISPVRIQQPAARIVGHVSTGTRDMSDRQDDQGVGVAPPPPKRPKQESKPNLKPKRSPPGGKLPPYNVVLLDDDDHTYDYVMEMLGVIFQYVQEKAFM